MKHIEQLFAKIGGHCEEVVEGRSNRGDARTRIAEIRALLANCESELDAENGATASSDPPPGGPPDGP
jgi:hypothetical protein